MVRSARQGARALDQLGGRARAVGDDFSQLNTRTQILHTAFGGIIASATSFLSLGAGRFFSSFIGGAASFETKMAEVHTLVDETTFDVERLEEALKSQSRAFGLDVLDQAGAAYQIISAGASDAAEAIEILDTANRLAIGGVTDVETAADGLTSVMNAYGISAGEAVDISDALFVAMRTGKTTIDDLSRSIGTVAPLAAAAGVSFDELSATIATITKGGIATSEAVTGVRAILTAVTKVSSQAAKQASELGLEFNVAAIQAQGFSGFLEEVITKANQAEVGAEAALANLFGRVEALVPVLAIAGATGQDYIEILEQMEGKSGATTEAVAKLTNTFESQADRLKQAFTVTLIDAGTTITDSLVPVLRALADNFDQLVRFVTVAATAFTTVLLPAVLRATAGLAAMAAAWLATPFGAITAAIIAGSAALARFGDATIQIGAVTTTVWGAFTASIRVARDLIEQLGSVVFEFFSGAVETASPFFNAVRTGAQEFVSFWVDALRAVAGFFKDAVNGMLGITIGFIRSFKDIVTRGIPDAFLLALGLARNIVIDAVDFIVRTVVSGFGNIGDALSYIPGVASDLGDQIRAALSIDFSGLRSDTQALRQDLSNTASAIRDVFSDALSRDYVGAAGAAFTAFADELRNRLIAELSVTEKQLMVIEEVANDVASTIEASAVPAVVDLGDALADLTETTSALNTEREQFIASLDREINTIRSAHGEAVDVVNEWYEEQMKRIQELGIAYEGHEEKLRRIFEDRLERARDRDLQNADDWASGVERAIQRLGQGIENNGKIIENILTDVFDTVGDAIGDLVRDGKLDLKDLVRSLAASIAEMTARIIAFKAISSLFGDGGQGGGGGGFDFASIFSGGPGGGSGGAPPSSSPFAAGGRVRGRGGPTSDLIPALLSDGEFVVNARAARAFLPVLEAINRSDRLGLAAGGLANEASVLPAQPRGSVQPASVSDSRARNNITIIPTINASDVVDTFDSDDGDRVLVNMLERNRTTIRGILS